MAIGDVINDTLAETILADVGEIGLWIQAIGLLVVIWLVFQTVNLFLNIRRVYRIEKMKKKIDSIENKIDKLIKKRK